LKGSVDASYFQESTSRMGIALRHISRLNYDQVGLDHNLVKDTSGLIEFTPSSFYTEFSVKRLSGVGADRVRRSACFELAVFGRANQPQPALM
jgi:hypothetical protein